MLLDKEKKNKFENTLLKNKETEEQFKQNTKDKIMKKEKRIKSLSFNKKLENILKKEDNYNKTLLKNESLMINDRKNEIKLNELKNSILEKYKKHEKYKKNNLIFEKKKSNFIKKIKTSNLKYSKELPILVKQKLERQKEIDNIFNDDEE